MPVNLRLYLFRRAQRVPQGVDLVQHHKPGFNTFAFGDQMFAPDGQIGFGDPCVCRKNENHRMRLGNEADGQLGFGTNGVETRRIEDNQSLLEQRMRNIDQGVAPFRHFDHAVRTNPRIVFRMVVVPEPEKTRIVQAHMTYLGNLFHGFCELCRIVDIQVNARPFFGHRAPFHQRLALQSRFYRQQSKARRNGSVVA